MRKVMYVVNNGQVVTSDYAMARSLGRITDTYFEKVVNETPVDVALAHKRRNAKGWA